VKLTTNEQIRLSENKIIMFEKISFYLYIYNYISGIFVLLVVLHISYFKQRKRSYLKLIANYLTLRCYTQLNRYSI